MYIYIYIYTSVCTYTCTYIYIYIYIHIYLYLLNRELIDATSVLRLLVLSLSLSLSLSPETFYLVSTLLLSPTRTLASARILNHAYVYRVSRAQKNTVLRFSIAVFSTCNALQHTAPHWDTMQHTATQVKDLAEPCFPPAYRIFEFFVERYHALLVDLVGVCICIFIYTYIFMYVCVYEYL